MLRKLFIAVIAVILLLTIPVRYSNQNEKSAVASAADFGSTNSVSENEEIRTQSASESILRSRYDLAAERSMKSRYYCMETKIVYLGEDGTRTVPITLRLLLKCVPAGYSPQDGYLYTCAKLAILKEGEPEVHIPALDGWTYMFKRAEDGGFNHRGLIYGIDHGRFQGLKDGKGNALPPEGAYGLYNMFIDFHAFCNQFAEKSMTGNGIQSLKRIGKKIVHESAFSEPTMQLSGSISEGSFFRNGEVTLEFKGLSIVDGVACAIVRFDSGDSSFKFLINPTPDMDIKTVGAAHYWGDLYIELDSKWVRKVEMGELTVSKVTLGKQKDINSVMERSTTISAMKKDEFESILKVVNK
ncbi:MAG: hypothetical protein GY774_30035 [Planctomycetes bacterium]|nr:hypothetical protein [Planctomycetota bacterium]